MTGLLRVRLDKWLDGDALQNGVLANIYAVGTAADRPARGRDVRDLIIPAGQASPRDVELEAGRYAVEAVLPSGEIVADEVDVPDGRTVDLDLRSGQSPHEWLSWQQFLGNVAAIESYAAGVEATRAPEPVAYWVGEPTPPLAGDSDAGADAWALLREVEGLPGETAADRLSDGQAFPALPFQTDDFVSLYQATGEGPWNDWNRPSGNGGPPVPRRYLVVETAATTELVSLPVPWVDVETDEQRVAQVLVRKAGDARVAVIVRDPSLGSALGYMKAGELSAAGQIFDQAQDMLYGKRKNAHAAAAGGYVLLATEQGADDKDWHQWTENLARWFEWLPDGAIQHGWLKVRHRRSEEDVGEALEWFLTAYRRGLPFYSVGLQWLVDGLTLFAAEDAKAAEALENVRRIAWRTNTAEPFTIVRLSADEVRTPD